MNMVRIIYYFCEFSITTFLFSPKFSSYHLQIDGLTDMYRSTNRQEVNSINFVTDELRLLEDSYLIQVHEHHTNFAPVKKLLINNPIGTKVLLTCTIFGLFLFLKICLE